MTEDKKNHLDSPFKLETEYIHDREGYNSMQYRFCGKSGLKLPLITLGLWQNFGNEVSFNSSRRMILNAFDMGITHFDLGNNYGNPPGSSEETFGRILSGDLKKYRDEILISTKAGYDMWPGPYGQGGSRKYLISSVDQSLKRLGIDYLDIFYSHHLDPKTPLEETMGALEQIVRQGKALYVGISSYGKEETIKAHNLLSELGISCTIHQSSYSLFNRWIEKNEFLVKLKELGIGCITFAPLEQGLLSGKYLKSVPLDSRMRKGGSSLKKEVLVKTRKSLDYLNKIAKKRGQSLSQMAISWTLRNSTVVSTIIGTRTLNQLGENVGSLQNLTFSKEELTEINKYAKDEEITLWPPNC